MRSLLVIGMLAVGACNVSHDATNDEVTMQYDENRIENTAEDVGNAAENIGAAIANEADDTADKVSNSGIVADGDRNADASNTANRQ